MEETNLDQFTLTLDDNEELNAAVLTNLLNSGVEEALSRLSPAQLMQLERNVQKLKRQKTPTTGHAKASKGGRKRSVNGEEGAEAECLEQDQVYEGYEAAVSAGATNRKRSVAGHMNLPASTPQTEFRDGIEFLHFTYSTKGHSEYCIRSDLDDLSLDDIPEEFKIDNCVYPRALVPRETYIGNRWEYETQVNEVAWKLCWKNPEILCGKRGLIQRAVDSYRNRATESRSRRVMRQDKLATTGLAPRRRNSASQSSSTEALYAVSSASGSASSIGSGSVARSLSISYTDKDGQHQKTKVNVDIETVDLAEIPEDFKRHNCLYPQALLSPDISFAEGRWEYENSCNELAWKLAWLNAPKIAGRRNLLRKTVDAYQTRIEASERARQSIRRSASVSGAGVFDPHQAGMMDAPLDKSEEFSQLVAHTLQQALNQHVQPDGKPTFPQMM